MKSHSVYYANQLLKDVYWPLPCRYSDLPDGAFVYAHNTNDCWEDRPDYEKHHWFNSDGTPCRDENVPAETRLLHLITNP